MNTTKIRLNLENYVKDFDSQTAEERKLTLDTLGSEFFGEIETFDEAYEILFRLI